ncbi:MAG: hypothetical protein ABSB87_13740 [Terriglobales bacterium]|jgi:hypothetical protein
MATNKAVSIADKWREQLDNDAERRMQNEAVDEQAVGGNIVYIFADGSSIYEKEQGDWRDGGDWMQCPQCDDWNSRGLCAYCTEDETEAV